MIRYELTLHLDDGGHSESFDKLEDAQEFLQLYIDEALAYSLIKVEVTTISEKIYDPKSPLD